MIKITGKLTGNWGYRISWNGKLVLQVEEKFSSYDGLHPFDFVWRDATFKDLRIP